MPTSRLMRTGPALVPICLSFPIIEELVFRYVFAKSLTGSAKGPPYWELGFFIYALSAMHHNLRDESEWSLNPHAPFLRGFARQAPVS